jgi:hypothetical protein
MIEHRDALRGAVRKSQGMGLDQRTGELVLLVRAGEVDADERAVLDAELERLTGVAVRIEALNGASRDFAIGGGSRVEGVDPQDGRRYACTTGFVVTDGAQTGLVTAAHCPDELTYFSPDGVQVPLSFVGGWGARYQDVQVHVASEMLKPQFYPDTAKSVLRPLRAGEAARARGRARWSAIAARPPVTPARKSISPISPRRASFAPAPAIPSGSQSPAPRAGAGTAAGRSSTARWLTGLPRAAATAPRGSAISIIICRPISSRRAGRC